jgi:hypothetical protein
MQVVADTTKTKKHEKMAVNSEAGNDQDRKKQKEIDEASQKLEKAQLQMQKAKFELERAREEFRRTGGQMRNHDMADLSEENAKHLWTEDQMREFKLKHEKEFDEQRKLMELQRRAMQDDIRRSQEDMRRSEEEMKGERMRQQDMKREMEQYYRMQKDSGMHMKHRNPYMEGYPQAPVNPPAPPADIDAPGQPDVQDLVQPEPVEPMKMLNDNQGTGKKKNSELLDSKLKEAETE